MADPAVPLEDTVAYVNFDIQGSNLLPSLADGTIVVGAETGGPNLVEAAEWRRAALEYHEFPTPGKLQVTATKQMINQRDLALAYSPGEMCIRDRPRGRSS